MKILQPKPNELDLTNAKINPRYALDMQDILREEMQDPEFRQAYEEESLKYKIIQIIDETSKKATSQKK